VSQTYARVVADSISPAGHRVTTFVVCFLRFVLAEFNTHRVFSRNSASSRAIPFAKQMEKVLGKPAIPLVWPKEQKGMQGGPDLAGPDAAQAQKDWTDAALHAVHYASKLAKRGVHKSVANRLLEPFLMHTVVVTATDWEGFFAQRCSPLAQPEIREAAEMMRAAYEASEPTPLAEGEWHLPFIDASDVTLAQQHLIDTEGGMNLAGLNRLLVKMSSARCARVSYETHEGKRQIGGEGGDLALYDKLVSAKPAHWSPLEHPCAAWEGNSQIVDGEFTDLDGTIQTFEVVRPLVGNFLGYRQHRFEMETAAA
jgi:thymidylate synthase ThyX